MIELYTNVLSATPGEIVDIHVSTTAPRFNLRISRLGSGENLVWTHEDLPGHHFETPEDAWKEGCRWPVSLRVTVAPEWASGYYQIKATTVGEGTSEDEAFAFIVVRAIRPSAPILMVLTTSTYGAYNDYGGASLYRRKDGTGDGVTGEHKVSFRRPWTRGSLWRPQDAPRTEDPHVYEWAQRHGMSPYALYAGFHCWERKFIRWLEQSGYAADFAISSDLEFLPEVLSGYRLMVSVGIDEYWSRGMRNTVETFIAQGGNVCFFSGDVSSWQVRYEDGGASLVCYKWNYPQDPHFRSDPAILTTMWSSYRLDRPDARMTGSTYFYGGYAGFGGVSPNGVGGYVVYRPEHWMFEGTGLKYGDVLGRNGRIATGTMGGCPIRMENGTPHPADFARSHSSLQILGMTPASPKPEIPGVDGEEILGRYAKELSGSDAPEEKDKLRRNQATMTIYTAGGTVFCAGTTGWAYGLTGQDPDVERVTRNLLDRLSSRKQS